MAVRRVGVTEIGDVLVGIEQEAFRRVNCLNSGVNINPYQCIRESRVHAITAYPDGYWVIVQTGHEENEFGRICP